MPDNLPAADNQPVTRSQSLNTIGLLILILGCGIALFVYWVGSNQSANGPADQSAGAYSDGPLSTQDSKRSTRDVAMYSGQLGVWMAECSDWVATWNPSTKPALIIAALSVLVALGFFAVGNRWI